MRTEQVEPILILLSLVSAKHLLFLLH